MPARHHNLHPGAYAARLAWKNKVSMFVDVWSNWLQRWRGIPARRVFPRPADAHRAEVLEERFLLGQLAVPSMPVETFPPVPHDASVLVVTPFKNGSSIPLPPLNVQPVPTVGMNSGQVDSVGSTAFVTSDQADSSATIGSPLNEGKFKSLKESLKASKADWKGAAPTRKPADSQPLILRTERTAHDATAGSSNSIPVQSGNAGSAETDGQGDSASLSSPAPAAVNPGAAMLGLGMSLAAITPVEGATNSTQTAGHVTSTGRTEILAAAGGDPQLTTTEVGQLLDRASAATPSEDAIIVVVDRQGIILGVRTEADIPTADLATLVFSIDGAVAKARTAAFFANNQAPLTSRTVRFISQTTITEREVNSNPSITDMTSTIAGPGFVGPIGLGGHFPPGVSNTPPVDLFAIEHTNRDSIDSYPGGEGRFNADYVSAAQEINAPGSYGVQSGLMPDAQPRGIATLPGGIPLFRDSDGNGVGDTVVGGIGVFFPGPDGYASFEQGFVHGDKVSTNKRTNAPKVIESEFMALAAIGSSRKAGVSAGPIGGVAPVTDIDLPFGRIDLVGITLEVVGPTAGIEGLQQLLKFGKSLGGGTVNGTDQMVTGADLRLPGTAVPTGWLVGPHAGGDLTAADVTKIINQGIKEANKVRAAIRLPIGSRTKMVFAVTDLDGNVLGLFRMDDATYFSLDVAVAKARNVAYYNDPTALQPEDRVLAKQDPAVNPKGVAFTARTFRFLVEPRYPAGQDGTKPGPFSILNESSINPKNAENLGAAAAANTFNTVQGYDSFNVGSNFRDTGSPADNQNGVVFFPGSSSVYKNGKLVGGLGVSGDGVDQDDVVTDAAIAGFAAPSAIRADRYTYRKVRLPYTKFLRNPRG